MNEIEVLLSFGGATSNINSTTSYNDGAWHYACIVWDSTKRKLTFSLNGITISVIASVMPSYTLPER